MKTGEDLKSALGCLPGGGERRWEVLLEWLHFAKTENPTVSELVAWARKRYTGNRKGSFIPGCLRDVEFIGLLTSKSGTVCLTLPGERILREENREVLYDLIRRFKGIREVEELGPDQVFPRSHIRDVLNRKFHWKETTPQADNRVDWLMACGRVEKVKRGHYRILPS